MSPVSQGIALRLQSVHAIQECDEGHSFRFGPNDHDHPDYLASVEYGRKMAEAGWMVVTGAGGGIMKALHPGAAMSMGVNIMLPLNKRRTP